MLIEGLITTPSRLHITDAKSQNQVLLGVKTLPDDYVFVLGRGAQTIKALQAVMRAIGQARGAGYVKISVEDPGQHRVINSVQVPINPGYGGNEQLGDLLTTILAECAYRGAAVVPGNVGNTTFLKAYTPRDVPPELRQALEIIFRAIGRMNGRWVEVDFERR
jgi:predicted RNA-binding protein YlqC (UPF0109 family)